VKKDRLEETTASALGWWIAIIHSGDILLGRVSFEGSDYISSRQNISLMNSTYWPSITSITHVDRFPYQRCHVVGDCRGSFGFLSLGIKKESKRRCSEKGMTDSNTERCFCIPQ